MHLNSHPGTLLRVKILDISVSMVSFQHISRGRINENTMIMVLAVDCSNFPLTTDKRNLDSSPENTSLPKRYKCK